MVGSGRSCKVALDFGSKQCKHITHDTAAKFKKTGGVTDQPRSGRPQTSSDEGTSNVVDHVYSNNVSVVGFWS